MARRGTQKPKNKIAVVPSPRRTQPPGRSPDRTSPDHRLLFEIAADQGGYFTTPQAHEAGFSDPLIHYHAQRGKFRPIWLRHGLYRLLDFPTNPHDELWAALVAVGPEAVLSHESALRLHNLSDVTPRLVHLWIPYVKRPRMARSIPHGVKIHVARVWLQPHEVTLVDGLRVTTPLRTLLDIAASGTLPDQVVAAIKQGLERKWFKTDEFIRAAHARGPRVTSRVDRFLREATE